MDNKQKSTLLQQHRKQINDAQQALAMWQQQLSVWQQAVKVGRKIPLEEFNSVIDAMENAGLSSWLESIGVDQLRTALVTDVV